MKNRRLLATQLMKELTLYTEARAKNQHDLCLKYLGRAHIISQYKWFNHFYIHFLMLEYAWSRKDGKEIYGQIIRGLATVPGHLFGKLPRGNTGWSSVPLTKELPVPSDLKHLL